MTDRPITDETAEQSQGESSRRADKLLIVLRSIWIVVALLTIGLYFAALPQEFLVLRAATPDLHISLWQLGISVNFYATYFTILRVITMLFFALTAFVVFWSRSTNRMTLLISFGLLTFGAIAFPTLDALVAAHPVWRIPVIIIQAIGLGSSLLVFYLFPDGKFVPHWTRPLAYIWIGWVIAWISLPASISIEVENWPIIVQMIWRFFVRADATRFTEIYQNLRLYSLGLILIIWFGTGVFAQVFRFRHVSTNPQKQQTKWVVFGLSTAAIGYLLIYLIFGSILEVHPTLVGILLNLGGNTLLSICYMLVPLTLAISILRFQLWDIDFLINQTLVYGTLTALVSLFYVGDVILLQAIFRAVTGGTSDMAIVISTLILASIFQPLRKRMQSIIDRMFFREKVDFRLAFTEFALEIRTIIDLPELLRVLIERITSLLHISHGAVYLYEDGKFKLAEATNLNPDDASRLPISPSALQRLRNSSAVLNPNHPVFPILVPLMAPRATSNQFIGILALGPRRSGQSYAREDRALLYSLTDQAGTAIHVAQLIEEKQAEIQRREAAERSLEDYRNSPVGRAEALAQKLVEHPEFAIVLLYRIAQDAGKVPQIAGLLDNLPQALERVNAEPLTSLARAIDYIFASQWTPELLIVGMRTLTDILEDHHRDYIYGEQVLTIYLLFQRAINANSIPQIIEAGEDPDWLYVLEEAEEVKLPPEKAQHIPPEFLPYLEELHQNSTGAKATESIPELIATLRAYERVDTSQDKLAYLASAVEKLRHVDYLARTSGNSPDRPVVQQIADSWLRVITSAITDLQTRAQITCQLLTRNTWRNDVISLVLNVRNDGRGAALNLQITLASAPEYSLINASETLARLAPGEETQVQLSVRPHLDQGIDRMRARFVILYTDPRGPDQIENFADIVQLMKTAGEFKFIPNPYVVGTPLQMGSPLFFGRQDVISYIQDNLAASHRNNLVLIGQRRTGKTSLLKQLPGHLGDDYLPVYLDGQSLGLDPGLPNFFLNLATEIIFALEDREFFIDTPEPEDFANSPATTFEKQFLPTVRTAIGERHLLILLDEFEELETAIQRGNLDASIFSFLRHIIQHSENMSVVFCGTHRIEELAADYWSVLFNISLYRSIGFLERDEALRLIQDPVIEFDMRYDDLAFDKIWRVSAGHPYFLQLLCHSLVNWHNKTERSYVTISDVNAALDEILSSGEAHFVYLWSEATPIERIVLATLSRIIPLTGQATPVQITDYLVERGVSVERQAIQDALHHLSLREVLESFHDPAAGIDEAYRWKLGLLGMWVEKYKSMSRVMDEVKTDL
jgi:MFS family permease